MESYIYIEPFVYMSLGRNGCLLYNILNGKYTTVKFDSIIYRIIKHAKRDGNKYFFPISQNDNRDEIIFFIKEIREKYIGDIVKSKDPPIQLYPYIKDKVKNTGYKDTSKYLMELTIYLTSECDFFCEICKDADIQFNGCTKYHTDSMSGSIDFHALKSFIIKSAKYLSTINIIGGDISKYKDLDNLLSFLNSINIKVNITTNYRILHKLDFNYDNIEYTTIIDKCREDVSMDFIALKSSRIFFIVKNESDLHEYDNIDVKKAHRVMAVPYYNKKNLSFFKKYVFIDEDDLFTNMTEGRTIITNHLINKNNFGKLYILPNGKIKSNLNHEYIGDINSDHKAIIYNELISGKSWNDIRQTKYPCKHCMYKIICTPLDGYQKYFGPKICNLDLGMPKTKKIE